MERYQKSVLINAPIERVFEFHNDTNNLVQITPKNISISFETRGNPGLGQDIFLSIRQFVILKTRWHVRITEYEPPTKMVDQQIRGPFAYWKQTRLLTRRGGCTELTDVIEYELPLGIIGRIANSLVVRHQIVNMFAYRQLRTKALLEQ
ncbi:MAG: SRPBCC family protein [Ignavibacteria bacterium]|nr:SRPBCC family protein [Ignavibacteria bacterium]